MVVEEDRAHGGTFVADVDGSRGHGHADTMVLQVAPLDESFRADLDGVARARGYPTTGDVAALGAQVALLSEAYNADGTEALRRLGQGGLPARLGFSFPRDVPKGAAAVGELVTAGLLTVTEARPLRVLDLGAGLGATTWGVVRALAAAGRRGVVEATWVDADGAALGLGREVAARRPNEGAITLQVKASALPIAPGLAGARGPFDLVLFGQVLSELSPGESAASRESAHVELLQGALQCLAPDGSLVVVEPALRTRTRHLHRLRAKVIEQALATVFAPCLHEGPCPMERREADWCHEDLPVDLPPWLVPVARTAGLRFEGLTFSYLVLRKDGLTLAKVSQAHGRLVASPKPTKGKRSLLLCGPGSLDGVVVSRLDRHRGSVNGVWDTLGRGDLVAFEPPLLVPPPSSAARDAGGPVEVRLPPETTVHKVRAGGSGVWGGEG